ncbi:hypothetical protein [Staphylococcus gallinarum]|uniref:nuclear transport factor 2 family protein n=1 Tax=Staphylococcus gallinarum TaxID=1293 RepID=UPI000D1F158C|nr:hypothetical protein [Staphylococcus gallinarum]MCD8918091.1 hypothetical protein [Staphylococcus gallinarum]PTL14336.1 hypothetical protein BUZ08_13230 [Staphylococcus gallinarum]RIO76391.1 hypothetical protein BUZ07_13365 [Staphylococcus gallinarum]
MIEYEWFHLKSDNRSENKLLDILHPAFKEFGKSGEIYYKSDIERAQLDNDVYKITNFVEYSLSEDCVLCTYTLFNTTKNIITNRSSIWKYYKNDWKLLFHQGTQNIDN